MAIPERLREEVLLLPSILSADFSRLGEEVSCVMEAGAKIIHVDVMDGHFVPNMTVGPLVVKGLEAEVHGRGGYFSVHLMVENPEKYVPAFVEAGADALAIHAEASSHSYGVLELIRELGASPGIALNPASDLGRVADLKGLIDHVVVMTVNPGFAGQSMIEAALARVPELRNLLPADVAIEVDGGVKADNVDEVVRKGVNWIVAGSAVFGADDPATAVRDMQARMVA